MKKILSKQNILPLVVLGAICLVVAVLLALINSVTSPLIEKAQAEKAAALLAIVLPEGRDFEEVELDGRFPTEIKKGYKSDAGYVFETKVKGKESMSVMCGVDMSGKIVKMDILSEKETPGYKEKIIPLVTGDGGKYNGSTGADLMPEIASGATLTSEGLYHAAELSLDAFAICEGITIEKNEIPESTPANQLDSTEQAIRIAAGAALVIFALAILCYLVIPKIIGRRKNG